MDTYCKSSISGYVKYELDNATQGSVITDGHVTIDTDIAGTTDTTTLENSVSTAVTAQKSNLGVSNIETNSKF